MVPDFQSLFLPLLKYSSDQQEHSAREVADHLADEFQLSDTDRKQLLPSGRQTTFVNRTHWARAHLRMAGLLEFTRRGYFRITQRGLDLLATKPEKLRLADLKQYPEYVAARQGPKTEEETNPSIATEELSQSPEERLEYSYQEIRKALAVELLSKVMRASPAFFEELVVSLLVAMGYGGSRKDAGLAVGRAGDEGIDGIIKEDRLGLDQIYVQAKRWQHTVGRPEIQAFVGALHGQRARKGVFITTSTFARNATEYVKNIDSKVVLIDGEQLAQYMIDFDLGVTKVTSYDIKRIDSDFFGEE